MAGPEFEQILGVRFINASALEAIEYLEDHRGYLVVPAAPALVNIAFDAGYRQALVEADLAIADSGFMVLLWLAFRRRKIQRTSGLRYLQELFKCRVLNGREIPFLVLPSKEARQRSYDWFRNCKIELRSEHTYIATIYGAKLDDPELVRVLERVKPSSIIVAIGGGAQEKLGYYLRENLSYRPVIHCIGAALGFITGHQKPIPTWADRLYLGWLLRTLRQPRVFLPRFWGARKLPGLIWEYGERLPPLLSTGNEGR